MSADKKFIVTLNPNPWKSINWGNEGKQMAWRDYQHLVTLSRVYILIPIFIRIMSVSRSVPVSGLITHPITQLQLHSYTVYTFVIDCCSFISFLLFLFTNMYVCPFNIFIARGIMCVGVCQFHIHFIYSAPFFVTFLSSASTSTLWGRKKFFYFQFL